MASFTWEVETAPFPNAGTQVILMPAFKGQLRGILDIRGSRFISKEEA